MGGGDGGVLPGAAAARAPARCHAAGIGPRATDRLTDGDRGTALANGEASVRLLCRVLLAAAVAVVGLACNGAVDAPGGGSTKICDTRADAPIVVRLGAKTAVRGTAWSTCDVAPQSHIVTVWLQ